MKKEMGVLDLKSAFSSSIDIFSLDRTLVCSGSFRFFSKEYDIHDETGKQIARFERVSGWFSSGAFCLDNQSNVLENYEPVSVIIGMHAIQKRQRSSAGSGS